VAYSNAWRSINYGLTWTLSKNGGAGSSGNRNKTGTDQLLALSISVPLGAFLPQAWANYGLNASRHAGTTQYLGVNGVALEGNALSWNIQQGYGTSGMSYSGNMNGDYKSTYGEMTAGYSYDKNSDRLNYGLQGGVLAHADGVTFSQPPGETSVLIRAPGAAGVGVQNMTGVKTDYRGYTLAPNLMPYRKNDVGLVTETLPGNVELEQTVKTVVPTRGAIVRADYISHVGIRLLLTLTKPAGEVIPFGAMATVAGASGNGFIVGNSGQVYLTGLEPEETC
jgi:outer membrane usher protein